MVYNYLQQKQLNRKPTRMYNGTDKLKFVYFCKKNILAQVP